MAIMPRNPSAALLTILPKPHTKASLARERTTPRPALPGYRRRRGFLHIRLIIAMRGICVHGFVCGGVVIRIIVVVACYAQALELGLGVGGGGCVGEVQVFVFGYWGRHAPVAIESYGDLFADDGRGLEGGGVGVEVGAAIVVP